MENNEVKLEVEQEPKKPKHHPKLGLTFMVFSVVFAIVALIFGIFNLIFIGGFFKTAYKFGRPFVTHIILTFVMIGIGEALYHIPGLEALNAFGFECFRLQFCLLALGAVAYIALTLLSYQCACRNFERIDL